MLKILGVVIIAVFMLPIISEFIDDPNETGENTLEIFIIDGQSNAAYYPSLVDINVINEDYPELPQTNVYYYGTESTPITYGTRSNPTYDSTYESYNLHSMTSSNQWIIGGYEPGLASAISSKTGHDVLILNLGVPGATINELSPSGACGQYGKGIIEHALSVIDTEYDYNHVRLLGYMWAQGEADSATSIHEYVTTFNTINEYFESIGADNGYIVKTRARWGLSVPAMDEIIHMNSNIIMATTITDSFTEDNGLILSDNTHYTQEARDIIANIVGDEITIPDESERVYYSLMKIIPIAIIAGVLCMIACVALRAHA